MANQYRVEKVLGSEQFEGQFGTLTNWILSCRDLSSDRVGNVSINAKPENAYEAGQTFWAESKGAKGGVLKLKRVAPPRDGVQPAAQSPASLPVAGDGGKIPYVKALAAYKRFASDLSTEEGYPHEYATTMFLAWIKGQVGDPPPKIQRPDPQKDEPDEAPWPEEE